MPRLLLSIFLLLPGTLWSEVQEVAPQSYYRTFSRAHPPLKRVKPGDTIRTKTIDAAGGDEKGVRRHESGNPLTGPFYVEGAEPGDAVAATIHKLNFNRNWGWTSYRLGLYSLSPDHVQNIYSDRYKPDSLYPGRVNIVPWDIDIEKRTVRLREPVTSRIKLEFPAQPMLGCIGVAAPGDFAPISAISGSWGGNLDYNQIGEGATVILPVYHPGALFYLGDGHALQADGEPLGTGIETSFNVEFTLNLRKRANLTGPRLETSEYLISIGSQPEFVSPLDRALQLATTDMVQWLVAAYNLEPWAAHLLIGTQGRYQVITVAGSMALKIPKSCLPGGPPGPGARSIIQIPDF